MTTTRETVEAIFTSLDRPHLVRNAGGVVLFVGTHDQAYDTADEIEDDHDVETQVVEVEDADALRKLWDVDAAVFEESLHARMMAAE